MLEAWTLRQDSVRAEEEQLRKAIRDLPDPDRESFFRRYNKVLKDPDTYAVLNWFFLTGLHHFYLGKYFRGTVNLVVMILGFILLFVKPLPGILLVSGIVLIEIPALFRSQIIVANHNNRLGQRILEKEYTKNS